LLLCVSPINNAIAVHSVSHHQYADDTQLQPNTNVTFKPISECTDEVDRWFLENKLFLNPSKMEAMLSSMQVQCNKVNTSGGVEIAGTTIRFGDFIKLLGVNLDPSISMNRHVTELVRSCYHHICAVGHIRLLLTLESTKMVALSIVAAHLGYCNSLLYGTSSDNLWKLQVTQSALARVVCQATRTCSATKLRRQLHWLPVKQRIDYKLAVLTYKVRQSGSPSYLASLISDYVPSRSLRSSDTLLLSHPYRYLLHDSQGIFC